MLNNFKNLVSSETYTFRDFLTKVFFLVFLGIVISTLTASFLTGKIIINLLNRIPYLFFIIIFLQLGIALNFSRRLYKMSKITALLSYIFYCLSLGLTFAVLPFIYEGESLVFAGAMSACLFGAMVIVGLTIKADLSKFSNLLFMGLLMIVVVSLINNFFIHSKATDLFLAYIGIFVFLGLIAYDMQRLRTMYLDGYRNDNMFDKLAIYGAFGLYLDFINLFVRLLQIFGRRRD